jgi:hypothetical protein
VGSIPTAPTIDVLCHRKRCTGQTVLCSAAQSQLEHFNCMDFGADAAAPKG